MRLPLRLLAAALSIVALAAALAAQIPPGYYAAVDTSTPQRLRQTLHEIIDDHLRFPYTSSATDTWDILELADQDPADSRNVLDVYRNRSFTKVTSNRPYNREHTWPNSYGYPQDNTGNYPYTDCHALFLCDAGYNSSRSNKPFRFCSATCNEKTTDPNGGRGGGSGVYPGNSNWTSGSFTSGTWEVWIGRRGDVARALLYLDVRYEGGVHGVTGRAEPDLILTDDESLIAASNTSSNLSVAYMGMLSVLLQWHRQDPVDALERARNDVVYSFQGNRNPFVDHPEWVECVFAGACGGDTTPPSAPSGLSATGGAGRVDLTWSPSPEPDVAGYSVYRATTAGGPYARITSALLSATSYSDDQVTANVTYYYTVTATDGAGNESPASAEVSATPSDAGPPGGDPWINEIHYDNTGADAGEFVEVAGPSGTNLGGWAIHAYNGNGGAVYKVVGLTGTIPAQQGFFGTLAFLVPGLQNGAPDGLALVDPGGRVVEFLSYEGTLTATDGPASGTTSQDIGVSESGSTPLGYSLRRTGTGTRAADFVWQSPAPSSIGAVNPGQVFSSGPDTTPPAAPTALTATAGDGRVDLDWADNTEPDLAGYHVRRATAAGGPYTTLTGSLLTLSAFTDTSVSNGVTYYYVVTATDTSANESAVSQEVSARPQAGGGPATMHVAAITLGTKARRKGKEKGRAWVSVVDAGGRPVSGALVKGTFAGDVEGNRSATTGADGVAVLTTKDSAEPFVSFTFCVTSITHDTKTYDAAANVVTCRSR